MKDLLLYATMGVLFAIIFGHKILISDLEKRMTHVESITFDSARYPKT